MDDAFYIKEGDTSPALRYTLSPTVDLTGATVRFSMRVRGQATPLLDRVAATVVAPATGGVVQYDWQAGNTGTAGFYDAEFEVTYADSTIETFPNRGFIPVLVDGDIA